MSFSSKFTSYSPVYCVCFKVVLCMFNEIEFQKDLKESFGAFRVIETKKALEFFIEIC